MSRAILQVMVRGRVQGVGYRAWVEYQATASSLEGWVRNRRDGSVEALVSGPIAAVDDLIEACRHGPSAARVMDIEITPEEGAVTGGFEQRSTV